LLLTVGSGLLLYARRRVTVIYNVDLARLREDLAAAVRRTGRGAQPRYDGLVITPKPGPAPEEGAPPDSPPPGPSSGADAAPGPTGGAARVEITAFRGLRHATLRWRGGDASVRGEVEAALADALRRTESPPNPGAAWLMTVASFLLFLLL